VEQDPWECGGWSGDQNFPLVLMDANVSYIAHMIAHRNLSWASLIQSIFSHFIADEFNSFQPFSLRPDKWFFFLESSSTKIFNAILGCLLTQTPHQVRLPWFNHSGDSWWTVDSKDHHPLHYFFSFCFFLSNTLVRDSPTDCRVTSTLVSLCWSNSLQTCK